MTPILLLLVVGTFYPSRTVAAEEVNKMGARVVNRKRRVPLYIYILSMDVYIWGHSMPFSNNYGRTVAAEKVA